MSDATIEELLAHRHWLANLVRRLVTDPGTADDVVQDVCLAALQRAPGQRRGLRGWLAQVARNRVTDEWRRRAREDRRDRRAAVCETIPAASDVVARVEAEREVARLVLEMPEPYRSTLLLRYWRGLGPAAIGRKTGTPAGTVRSRLSRGHDMLRGRLDRRHDGDRRAWVLALMPVLSANARGGPPAMSLILKLAAVLLVVTGVGVGASLILADHESDATPPLARSAVPAPLAPDGTTVAEVGRPPAPDGLAAFEEPAAGHPAAGSEEDDPLESRVSFSFADVNLVQALEFLGKVKGVRFEIEAGAGETMAAVTLTMKDASLRDAIELLTKLSGCGWERRADGVILVRRDPDLPIPTPPEKAVPPRPEPKAPAVAEFDPIYPADSPPIELSESEGGEPIPPDDLARAIEVVVDRDGKRYLRLRPNGPYEWPPTEYAFWLRLSDLMASTPEATGLPVVLRLDRRAPAAIVRGTVRIRWLGLPIGETWLVTGGSPEAPVGAREADDASFDGAVPPRVRFPLAARGGHRNLKAMGGSRFTMGGEDLGLHWLAGAQEPDGAWRSDEDPVAATSLALLAFLGAGQTPTQGIHREQVKAGLDWLGSRQDGTGLIGDPGSGRTAPIGHSAATMALAEAYALSLGDSARRGPAQNAVDFLETREPDPASTHALTVARLCGLRVDVTRLTARVRAIGDASPLELAVGTLDRFLLGDTPDVEKAGKELLRHAPSSPGAGDLLLWLAAGDAAIQIGGDTWKSWNEAMKKTLLPLQRDGRAERGSFDPIGPTATAGGRVVATALAVLCLEVYFRYQRVSELR